MRTCSSRLHGSARGQDVYIIQSMSSPLHRNIMELLIMIDCLKRDSAGRITAVIPYMSYARSDKKDQPRVPITARLLADMIEVAGADRYMTIDLHAGQIQGFFSIPGDVLTAFHILSDYFAAKHLKDIVVATVDLGFAKKGRNFAAKLGTPLAFVEKRRARDDGRARSTTVIGEVEGKNVLLVDDEVLTSGSIQEAAKIVRRVWRPRRLPVVHARAAGSAGRAAAGRDRPEGDRHDEYVGDPAGEAVAEHDRAVRGAAPGRGHPCRPRRAIGG